MIRLKKYRVTVQRCYMVEAENEPEARRIALEYALAGFQQQVHLGPKGKRSQPPKAIEEWRIVDVLEIGPNDHEA